MPGRIVIEVQGPGRLSVDMRVKNISRLDKLFIFDALAESFELDERGRKVIGASIFAGGVKKVLGVSPDTVAIPVEVLDYLEKRGKSDI